jgi:class 3 adenylate cyclase/tetratricopeptide (TPR) repeat protein
MMMRLEPRLLTVLFTDIVGSTERASELGDRGWREVLAEHHAVVRRELRRFGGREANTAGDGFLATFDRPARAIRCAWAIGEAVRELGLEIRSGIHAGEVEGEGAAIGGITVHIGARVAAYARPGEVLVTQAVRELVTGAAFRFEDRGVHALKGVPGEWRLHALQGLPPGPSGLRTTRWIPELTVRQSLVAGLVLLSLLAGLPLLYLAFRDSGPFAPGEAVAGAAPGIAVLPFAVRGEGMDLWREGMVDLLSTGLDGAGGLRAIDSRTVLARWQEEVPEGEAGDLAAALEVARRSGARYALVGSAVAIGPRVRLAADIYDAQGATSLGQAQVEGAPDSVLQLVDRLAVQALGVILRTSQEDLPEIDHASVTTGSLPALKAYLEGEVLFRRSAFEAGLAAFQRAVVIDSTFALAFFRLSQSYGWTDNIESERAREALDRAIRFADRLPEREAILVRAEVSILASTLDQIGSMREALRKYPDDAEMWYMLGELYFHLGQPALIPMEESDRAFLRAVALDPGFTPAYIHVIENAFSRADSARAAKLVETYGRLAPGSLQDRLNRFAFALAFGGTESRASAAMDTINVIVRRPRSIGRMLAHPRFLPFQEEAQQAARQRPDAPRWSAIYLLWNGYSRGRFEATLERLDDPFLTADYRLAALYRLHHAGMTIPAARLELLVVTDTAEPEGFEDLYRGAYAVDRGQATAHAAAIERLRATARSARARGDSVTNKALEGAARALEGYALWKRGRPAETLPAFEAAQTSILGIGVAEEANAIVRWWLGELLLELDRPREAERYFRSFWYDPLARLYLARIYDGLGRADEARDAYAYFAEAWEGADPELRPMLDEARRATARLSESRRR